jgi:hypothetical protein
VLVGTVDPSSTAKRSTTGLARASPDGLPVNEALKTAQQVAQALDAALMLSERQWS